MKRILFLIFATTSLFSCKEAAPKEEKNECEAVAEKLYEHFNNHDWVKMADLYIENAEFKDPSLGTGIVKQTKKQIIEKYSALNKVFPDIKDKVIKMYPSGENNVIVEFVSSGTAPDKSKFELPICSILTIENGKITQDFTYYDNFEENK